MSALENIEALRVKMKAMQASMIEEYQAAFVDGSKDLFGAHPLLMGFRWNQSTPDFCDGEPCTFSANTDGQEMHYFFHDFKLFEDEENAEGESEGFDYEDRDRGTCWVTGYMISRWTYDADARQGSYKPFEDREQYHGIVTDAERFLSIFDSDYLEDAFNGNAQVSVYRDGTIAMEEYYPGY
jgi:hypothetical protein